MEGEAEAATQRKRSRLEADSERPSAAATGGQQQGEEEELPLDPEKHAELFSSAITDTANCNSRLLDTLLAANRAKNMLLHQCVDMTGLAEKNSQELINKLAAADIKREEAESKMRGLSARALAQQESTTKKEEVSQRLHSRQLAQKAGEVDVLKAQLQKRQAAADAGKENMAGVLKDLQQQRKMTEDEKIAELQSAVQRIDLEKSTVGAKEAQVALSCQLHRQEILTLLSIVDELSKKAAKYDEIVVEKTKIEVLLRRMDKLFASDDEKQKQLMEVALPEGWQHPTRFTTFDNLPSQEFKQKSPALYYMRLLDWKQLTVAQMTEQWGESAMQIAKLQHQLNLATQEAAKLKESNHSMLHTLREEKHRRMRAEEEIFSFRRDGRLVGGSGVKVIGGAAHAPGGGAAVLSGNCSTTTAPHLVEALNDLQRLYTSALDDKVAVVVELDAARAKAIDLQTDLDDLKKEKDELLELRKDTFFSDALSHLRLFYAKEMDRVNVNAESTAASLAAEKSESQRLRAELEECKKALAVAHSNGESALQKSKECTTQLRSTRSVEHEYSKQQLSDIISSLRQRRAQVKTVEGGHTLSTDVQPTELKAVFTALPELEKRLGAISERIYQVIDKAAVGEGQSLNPDVESMATESLKGEFGDAMSMVLNMVLTESKANEVLRDSFLRQRTADANAIAVLQLEVNTLMEAKDEIQKANNQMSAILEAKAVHTAETVLMHSIDTATMDCDNCQKVKDYIHTLEKQKQEANFTIESLEKELAETHRAHRQGEESLATTAHRLTLSKETVDELRLRLESSQKESTRLRDALLVTQQAVGEYVADEESEAMVAAGAEDGTSTALDGGGQEEEGSEDEAPAQQEEEEGEGDEQPATEEEHQQKISASAPRSKSRTPAPSLSKPQTVATTVNELRESVQQLLGLVQQQRQHVVEPAAAAAAPAGAGDSSDQAPTEDETLVVPEQAAEIVNLVKKMWSQVLEVQQEQQPQQHRKVSAASLAEKDDDAVPKAQASQQQLPPTQAASPELQQRCDRLQQRMANQEKETAELRRQYNAMRGERDAAQQDVSKARQETEEVQSELSKKNDVNKQMMMLITDMRKKLRDAELRTTQQQESDPHQPQAQAPSAE